MTFGEKFPPRRDKEKDGVFMGEGFKVGVDVPLFFCRRGLTLVVPIEKSQNEVFETMRRIEWPRQIFSRAAS